MMSSVPFNLARHIASVYFVDTYNKDDIVQECLLAWLENGSPSDPSLTYTIMRRRILNILNHELRRSHVHAKADLPTYTVPTQADLITAREARARMFHFLSTLSHKDKRLVDALIDCDGDQQEASAKCGLKYGTFRTRLLRLRRRRRSGHGKSN